MTSCLLDPTITRKNKITLTDYDYQRDIKNRLLMATITEEDLSVLEEILYSSLQIPIEKLSKNLSMSEETLIPILEKIAPSGLFSLEKRVVTVDKDMRKYFELEIRKFDEDFQPGMEFLQSLLKKPPIHVLPVWYALPKTSTHIFDSILEKNLLTPQIFLRYVGELNFGEPILKQIIEDVYNSENLELSASFLRKKYNISKELFAEYMLHLEFSFVCCLGYQKTENGWEEKITPFYEWAQYLRFIKNAKIDSIQEEHKIEKKRPSEFSFAEDLSLLLEECKTNPLELELQNPQQILLKNHFSEKLPFADKEYIHTLVTKLTLLKLAVITEANLQITKAGLDWLKLRIDDKAIYLYRHPMNKITTKGIPQELCKEKTIKETEKSITRVLQSNWVLFDEFLKGMLVPLNGDLAITLKKTGKMWKYSLPDYSEEECCFLRAVILDWLFEAALVQPGKIEGKDCFRVTSLGQTLFAR